MLWRPESDCYAARRRTALEPRPNFIYGTAWKEERTESLVAQALAAGFVAIDTANQRKHYYEEGVGAALKAAFESGTQRDDLWLQSKFTYQRGQDHRLPYDPAAPLATQVEQSFQSSLAHLHTDYLDSYVLHGPASRSGLTKGDWDVWRAMETLHSSRKARVIGVSNISLDQLRALCEGAEVKPAMVQNRCYARLGWDRDVRAFCRDHGIGYQGFSLLTANRTELAGPTVVAIAQRHQRTVPEVIFRFAMDVGMIPLTGTSSRQHMDQDLSCTDIELSDDEVRAIETISA